MELDTYGIDHMFINYKLITYITDRPDLDYSNTNAHTYTGLKKYNTRAAAVTTTK